MEESRPQSDLQDTIQALADRIGQGSAPDPAETLVVVEFHVKGLVRFLSHAEVLRLYQRALVRAGLALRYSQGFNPRPKLSVPLPKSVGMESRGDLVCFRLERFPDVADDSSSVTSAQVGDLILASLTGTMPDGLCLDRVWLVPSKTSIQPASALWIVTLKPSAVLVQGQIDRLLASDQLRVDRKGSPEDRPKSIDVRQYIVSLRIEGRILEVLYRILPSGSVRIGELLDLLQLPIDQLAAPVLRTNVQWRLTRSA